MVGVIIAFVAIVGIGLVGGSKRTSKPQASANNGANSGAHNVNRRAAINQPARSTRQEALLAAASSTAARPTARTPDAPKPEPDPDPDPVPPPPDPVDVAELIAVCADRILSNQPDATAVLWCRNHVEKLADEFDGHPDEAEVRSWVLARSIAWHDDPLRKKIRSRLWVAILSYQDENQLDRDLDLLEQVDYFTADFDRVPEREEAADYVARKARESRRR